MTLSHFIIQRGYVQAVSRSILLLPNGHSYVNRNGLDNTNEIWEKIDAKIDKIKAVLNILPKEIVGFIYI